MDNEKILKYFLIIGGIIELFVGIMFLFLDPLLALIGLASIPILIQLCGLFFICFGILLIYSSKDIETYVIIPLVNILLRFMVLVPAIYNMLLYPEFVYMLLFSLIYDQLWAIMVLILLKKCGFILKNS